MATKNKVLITMVVVAICGVLIALVVFGYISAEPLVGLLGVVTGVLISEYSHKESAREDRTNQLRLAALDRRLQSHQEAFTLWQRLIFADRRTEEFSKTVMDCHDWWQSNCLYLTADARSAFRKAYLSAKDHNDLVNMHEDSKLVQEAWSDVERAGKIIVEGVGLPAIGDEAKKVKNSSKNGDA